MTYGYVTNNPKLVQDGATDLAGDTTALFIPYVPAGSTKAARLFKKRGPKTNPNAPHNKKIKRNNGVRK